MGRYHIKLASSAHDPALARVAATAMPGRICVSFRREPSYLESNCVLGPERQTIVALDRQSEQQAGEVVALATRSVRELYVRGESLRVGYLGALRIVPEARGSSVLARGYRFLRELHEADCDRPAFYLTTIAQGNEQAIRVLTSGRAGLPRYHFLGKLHTLALSRRKRQRAASAYRVSTIRQEHDFVELLSFLNTVGRSHSFFPVYREKDFTADDPVFRNLSWSDIRLIHSGAELVGVVGLWNQQAFRQSVVVAYSGLLKLARPFYNAWARVTPGVALPLAGESIRQCYAAFPLLKHHDRQLMNCLLDTLTHSDIGEHDYVMLGLCDDDPLLPLARRQSAATYVTRLYAVSWEELPAWVDQLPQPYYLELGCL